MVLKAALKKVGWKEKEEGGSEWTTVGGPTLFELEYQEGLWWNNLEL